MWAACQGGAGREGLHFHGLLLLLGLEGGRSLECYTKKGSCYMSYAGVGRRPPHDTIPANSYVWEVRPRVPSLKRQNTWGLYVVSPSETGVSGPKIQGALGSEVQILGSHTRSLIAWGHLLLQKPSVALQVPQQMLSGSHLMHS
eukprot:1160501-Pelagomonas_calceolata.AAC.6